MASLQIVNGNEIHLDGVIIEGKVEQWCRSTGRYKKRTEDELGDLLDEAIEKALNVRPVSIPSDPWKLFACLIIKYLKETLGDVTVTFVGDKKFIKKDKKPARGEVLRSAGLTKNTFFTMCCYVKINHSESHCLECGREVLPYKKIDSILLDVRNNETKVWKLTSEQFAQLQKEMPQSARHFYPSRVLNGCRLELVNSIKDSGPVYGV